MKPVDKLYKSIENDTERSYSFTVEYSPSTGLSGMTVTEKFSGMKFDFPVHRIQDVIVDDIEGALEIAKSFI